ncbi:aminotransferase class III-fold pyridoxal phosphate-dependent enzyme [Pseudooceanicola sp. CBS1P-1]|uniref:Aminotransferase class III-fold pyridoxal phosphate-dependent enzyme n=1 Tax=Pseudooceanicola albus TaxID=2692189 RepID=A0A6L7G548_9RHOB|nr:MULTISPECIES: aminotransferase class III-fold pyridoxal phosphate-dependent enzyme [Pseudooceanicola]MBT9385339.1 aminotransferase class III-fold pyridoxal phosphate-dependent enzyme [Pseudooceanicola endophyticus]MXN18802.1 aminotransferase class III-fold pyridoxal phosphate-dependent enzyme [Pseudooceanicola albus]
MTDAFTSDLDAALDAARSAYVARNPGSAAALERARRVMPGGNTRTSLWSDPFPLSVASGQGCHIRDVDGHDYVDFLGEFTAGIFGHTAPALAEAMARVHAEGINLSSHTPYEAALAERLVARFPSMELLRFANSGTEANLMALTTARLVTGRPRVVVFQGGYHGGVLTFGHGNAPVNVPFDFAVLPYNDAGAARAEFAAHGPEIAAVLIEPMQGAGGCRAADPQVLQLLRDLCTETGALLIFDEVQTARMSEGGAQARLGITPDMTTIGKFFGGGLAFGAFGGRADIMNHFDPTRPDAIGHAGTFNNNRLTMAAGLAALDHYLTPKALDALFARGEAFRAALNARFDAAGGLFHVTGMGSIMNIHGTGPEAAKRLRLLHFRMQAEGYYFAARGLIALSLPIGAAETDGFLDAIERVLAA